MEAKNEELVSLVQNEGDTLEDDQLTSGGSDNPAVLPPPYSKSDQPIASQPQGGGQEQAKAAAHQSNSSMQEYIHLISDATRRGWKAAPVGDQNIPAKITYNQNPYRIPPPQTSYTWQGIGSRTFITTTTTTVPPTTTDPEVPTTVGGENVCCPPSSRLCPPKYIVDGYSLMQLKIWAVVVLFCCSWIGGLIALYFYSQAATAYRNGDQAAAKKAMTSAIFGMVIATIASFLISGGVFAVSYLIYTKQIII